MAFCGDMLIKFEFEVRLMISLMNQMMLGVMLPLCYCGGMVYVMMMRPVLTLLWVMSMVPWVTQIGPVLYQGRV